MRTRLALVLLAIVAPAALGALGAQGWIVPRPCAPPTAPPCRPDGPCPRPMPRACPGPTADERTWSNVRVELPDRVLRCEISEMVVYRGGELGHV